MKKSILYTLTAICTVWAVCGSLTACSEDELSSTSVIKESQKEENEFDRWILKSYTEPYNIDIKYRMEDIESDQNYNLVPASLKQSIIMAQVLDYICLQLFDKVTGSKTFIRTYFPKMIHFIGSGAFENNGNHTAGTAEGGLKITLYSLNFLNFNDLKLFNDYHIRVVFHEFAHILHQRKPYTSDFKEISGSNYISDSWSNTYKTEDQSLPKGFISPYASKDADEDFVEMIAYYIISTPEMWSEKFKKAGTTGAPILNAKFEIAYNYMLNTWNVNLSDIREEFHKRENNFGNINWGKL